MKFVPLFLGIFLSFSAYANQCDDCPTKVKDMVDHVTYITTLHSSPTVYFAADVERAFQMWKFENSKCVDFRVRTACYDACLQVVKNSGDIKYGKRNCSGACELD